MKRFLLAALLAMAVDSAIAADATDAGFDEARFGNAETADSGWSGFYAGAFASYNQVNYELDLGIAALRNPGTANDIGGGAFAGYNWQSGNLVFGLEAEATALAGEHTTNQSILFAIFPVRIKRDWTASVRARLGVDLGKHMPYVFGGVSRTNMKVDIASVVNMDEVYDGYVFGAGLDSKLTETVFSRIELGYADYKEERDRTCSCFYEADADVFTLRLGLGLRF